MTFDEIKFEEFFDSDLDSWFSADIACCDNCYDDFVSRWPGTYMRDMHFQCKSIGLGAFYSGSKFCNSYTEEEFWKYIQTVKCPVCRSPLTSNIWLYNFSFESPQEYSEFADEIATIARNTPFLVLEHPFAKNVFDIIIDSFQKCDTIAVGSTYYRGRYKSQISVIETKEFKAPPAEKTREGRYNHAGMPVLYFGSDIKTCYAELGGREGVYVAETLIKSDLSALDLNGLYGNYDANEILLALVHSSLLSAPKKTEGWHNPQYVFSRFIADCAKSAGYDAIKYPTTKSSKGHNLVILDPECPLTESAEIIDVYSFDGKIVSHIDFKAS